MTANALSLYVAVTTRFAKPATSETPRCACGEPLEDEFERENRMCWCCQAAAAGCVDLNGIHHRPQPLTTQTPILKGRTA